MSQCLLKTNSFKCMVSSTLNKDVKQNGKKFMFDDRMETCWSSDQGNEQWLTIEFEQPVNIGSIAVQFQGGFVAKTCQIALETPGDEANFSETIYPEDINPEQIFKFSETREKVCKLKMTFIESSDFFGRIVIYSLKMFS
jgi:F5/8 type C domain